MLHQKLFEDSVNFAPCEQEILEDFNVDTDSKIFNYIDSMNRANRNKNVDKLLIIAAFGAFKTNRDSDREYYSDDVDGGIDEDIGFVPATKSSIEALEKVLDLGFGFECVVCFGDEKKQAKRMPCGHMVHDRCIEEWLEKSHLKKSSVVQPSEIKSREDGRLHLAAPVEGFIDEDKLLVLKDSLVGWCKSFMKIKDIAKWMHMDGIQGRIESRWMLHFSSKKIKFGKRDLFRCSSRLTSLPKKVKNDITKRLTTLCEKVKNYNNTQRLTHLREKIKNYNTQRLTHLREKDKDDNTKILTSLHEKVKNDIIKWFTPPHEKVKKDNTKRLTPLHEKVKNNITKRLTPFHKKVKNNIIKRLTPFHEKVKYDNTKTLTHLHKKFKNNITKRLTPLHEKGFGRAKVTDGENDESVAPRQWQRCDSSSPW
ncbi:hypothetical protein F3Y22_tig00111197pilonHSYRG00006 [Hibiscus syriacus]|uniref:RING-type E3 ubiquitin transferase n=1 Tax=Hibiscus syriacus TaxID=106335 RepID=A0A6A2YWD4_HIBSY|nr:hypothetical protein F3Y22_tig00111197pilonHSYRG00006 [Hibiscus syriacus]